MNARTRARLSALPLIVAAALFLLPAHAAASAPAPVIVSPASSTLVSAKFNITGRVGPGVTAVRVTGARSAAVTLLPADSEGATFTVRATVRYGRTTISLVASDGTAWSHTATLKVWHLDVARHSRPFLLVDKSDYMLYLVRGRRVVASYPVAVGMRGTPTRVGHRYLGRPVSAPNSVWGPFRMRLYRKASVRVSYIAHVNGHHVRRWHRVVRKVATSYYIHGTNNPDSIGTNASHGCIRMFNSQLRALRDRTFKYQLTIIRS